VSDEELSSLERAYRVEPTTANLLTLVGALRRAGRAPDAVRVAWPAFRASRDLGLFDAMGAPFTLTPFGPPGEPHRFLGADLAAPIVVGRREADVRIANPTMSRRHFSVAYVGQGRFLVRDVDSRGGTYIRDHRIVEQVVREGTRVGNPHAGVEITLGWGD
jgi:hypothetical protein